MHPALIRGNIKRHARTKSSLPIISQFLDLEIYQSTFLDCIIFVVRSSRKWKCSVGSKKLLQVYHSSQLCIQYLHAVRFGNASCMICRKKKKKRNIFEHVSVFEKRGFVTLPLFFQLRAWEAKNCKKRKKRVYVGHKISVCEVGLRNLYSAQEEEMMNSTAENTNLIYYIHIYILYTVYIFLLQISLLSSKY